MNQVLQHKYRETLQDMRNHWKTGLPHHFTKDLQKLKKQARKGFSQKDFAYCVHIILEMEIVEVMQHDDNIDRVIANMRSRAWELFRDDKIPIKSIINKLESEVNYFSDEYTRRKNILRIAAANTHLQKILEAESTLGYNTECYPYDYIRLPFLKTLSLYGLLPEPLLLKSATRIDPKLIQAIEVINMNVLPRCFVEKLQKAFPRYNEERCLLVSDIEFLAKDLYKSEIEFNTIEALATIKFLLSVDAHEPPDLNQNKMQYQTVEEVEQQLLTLFVKTRHE